MNYSFSALSTFKTCSLKYYFRYILGIEFTGTNIAAFLGSVCHEVFEHYFRSSANLTEQELKQNFLDLFLLGLETENIQEAPPYKVKYNREMGLKIIDEFIANKSISGAKPAKFINDDGQQEEMIEVRFDIPFIDLKTGAVIDEDIIITAIVDLVEDDEGKLIVKDHKTASRDYHEFFVEHSLQLAMYAYAIRYMLKQKRIVTKSKKEAKVAFNMFLKEKGSARSKVIERKITDEDIAGMQDLVSKIHFAVKNGVFLPANNEICFAYNTNCEYMNICDLYQKNKFPFVEKDVVDQEKIKEIYGDSVSFREKRPINKESADG